MTLYIVHIVSSLACMVAISLALSLRRRHLVRPSEFSWRGVVGLSLLLGALPAMVYAFMAREPVEIPEEVIDRIVIPANQ